MLRTATGLSGWKTVGLCQTHDRRFELRRADRDFPVRVVKGMKAAVSNLVSGSED